MTCPNCNASDEPAAVSGQIAVCATCGCTCLVQPDGDVRRAVGADTLALDTAELQRLQRVRAPIVRPRRRES